MAYQYFNPNPKSNHVGDCVVRALSAFLGESWEKVYADLCLQGFIMGDMPNSNAVWGAYLRNLGYERFVLPNNCPDCYTVEDFANDHPDGDYILSTGTHTIAVISGDWMDSWDSKDEIATFFWRK